jgi:hypothetical protein
MPLLDERGRQVTQGTMTKFGIDMSWSVGLWRDLPYSLLR